MLSKTVKCDGLRHPLVSVILTRAVPMREVNMDGKLRIGDVAPDFEAS